MDRTAEVAAQLIQGARQMQARKWSFLGFFVFAFVLNVALLAQFDLLPNALSISTVQNSVNQTETLRTSGQAVAPPQVRAEEPLRIEISSLKSTAIIANPSTTDVSELDKLLLKGAVRYPTSAKLGETGNVVLFGHSSYLPVVLNPSYKTFNGVQKLSKGDLVTVYSLGTAYTYTVRSVTKESAANNANILLAVTGRVLTLVTCNSFGATSDRFVVVADFVESHSLEA